MFPCVVVGRAPIGSLVPTRATPEISLLVQVSDNRHPVVPQTRGHVLYSQSLPLPRQERGCPSIGNLRDIRMSSDVISDLCPLRRVASLKSLEALSCSCSCSPPVPPPQAEDYQQILVR